MPCAGARSRSTGHGSGASWARTSRTNNYTNTVHRKDIRHTIRHLLRKHQDQQDKVLTIEQFAGLIAEPTQGELTHAALIVADLPGPAIIVTRDLYQNLLRRSADDVPARATA